MRQIQHSSLGTDETDSVDASPMRRLTLRRLAALLAIDFDPGQGDIDATECRP